MLLAAACGSAAPLPSGPITPGTPDHPRDVPVVLKDYYYVPNLIRLVPGETVRFQLIDGGLLAHEFVLGGPAVQAACARAEAVATQPVLAATAPPISLPPQLAGLRVYLASGQERDVIYQVPSMPQPLQVACHIPGHLEKGMVAGVEFVDPQGSPLPGP